MTDFFSHSILKKVPLLNSHGIRYILSMGILCYAGVISGQQISKSVISNGGENLSNETISLEWTLGEIAVENYLNGSVNLQEGFHGQSPGETSTSILEKTIKSTIKIWPNPTNGLMYYQSIDPELSPTFLINTDGRFIPILRVFDNVLDLSNLSNGQYQLVFRNRKGDYGIKRIIKIR